MMAAAALGLFSQQFTAGQASTGNAATPMASPMAGADDTSNTSSDSATISANDFLTLLVTEMQNQDPTASTDPNEYINQLVQVNSLEQLININQTLTTDSEASQESASTQTANASANAATANAPTANAASATGSSASAQSSAGTSAAGTQAAAGSVSGNLSIPSAQLAALRVAHALDGRSHTRSTGTQSSAQ
jgi:flagellar basal-body rod modification protein FlgD